LGAEQHGNTYLLIAIKRFMLHTPAARVLWNHATLHPVSSENGEMISGDVRLYDDDGQLIAEALGLELKLASREALVRAVGRQTSDLFYEVSWQPAPRAEVTTSMHTSPSVIAGQVEG